MKGDSSMILEQLCFQLTESEYENLWSHFATSSEDNTHGGRYIPYVFIRQWIAMFSTVLKSDVGVELAVVFN